MQRSIPGLFFLLTGVVACSGEPFRLGPDQEATLDAGPAVARPWRPDHSRLPEQPASSQIAPALAAGLAGIGFAASGYQTMAAFDRASGAVFAQHAFDGPVTDATWDPVLGRLLVSAHDAALTGSQITALTLGASGFELAEQSEPFGLEARLEQLGETTVVMTEDVGTSWTVLDSALDPCGPSKLLARPSGLAAVESSEGPALVALNPSLLVDGVDGDELLRVGWSGSFQISSVAFRATRRPASRLAYAPGRDELHVVRKHDQSPVFELGQTTAQASSAPESFRTVAVAGMTGELVAAILEPTQQVLVAALSRGTDPGALALVPLEPGAEPASVVLDGVIEASPWYTRQLVLDRKSGTVLVARGTGVLAFRPSGTASAPALELESGFQAPALRAPLVLP